MPSVYALYKREINVVSERPIIDRAAHSFISGCFPSFSSFLKCLWVINVEALMLNIVGWHTKLMIWWTLRIPFRTSNAAIWLIIITHTYCQDCTWTRCCCCYCCYLLCCCCCCCCCCCYCCYWCCCCCCCCCRRRRRCCCCCWYCCCWCFCCCSSCSAVVVVVVCRYWCPSLMFSSLWREKYTDISIRYIYVDV